MKEFKQTGWIIYNPKHTVSGTKMICMETFASTKKRAIDSFCNGSVSDWKFWKEKFNFKVVKCEQTIKIL